MTTELRVTAMDHIVLKCRDIEATLTWYLDASASQPMILFPESDSFRLIEPASEALSSNQPSSNTRPQLRFNEDVTTARMGSSQLNGEPRTTFFTRFGVKADPELPIHLIFDGKGELSCVVEGAIDDGDYAEVERIASGL